VRAGSLRDRLTFTRPLDSSETTQNSFGEDQGSAAAVGTFWGFVEPMSGQELEVMQQKWAQAKWKIKLRHQPGITFTRKMLASFTPRGAASPRVLDILDVQDQPNLPRPEIIMIAQDFNG